MCLHHLEYLQRIKCEKLTCLEMRSHIAWYIKGLRNSAEIKNKIYQVNKVCDIINFIINKKNAASSGIFNKEISIYGL